jgi:hypothetical protein
MVVHNIYIGTYLLIASLSANFTILTSMLFKPKLRLSWFIISSFALCLVIPLVIIVIEVAFGSLMRSYTTLDLSQDQTNLELAFIYFAHNIVFLLLSGIVGIMAGQLIRIILVRKTSSLVKSGKK